MRIFFDISESLLVKIELESLLSNSDRLSISFISLINAVLSYTIYITIGIIAFYVLYRVVAYFTKKADYSFVESLIYFRMCIVLFLSLSLVVKCLVILLSYPSSLDSVYERLLPVLLFLSFKNILFVLLFLSFGRIPTIVYALVAMACLCTYSPILGYLAAYWPLFVGRLLLTTKAKLSSVLCYVYVSILYAEVVPQLIKPADIPYTTYYIFLLSKILIETLLLLWNIKLSGKSLSTLYNTECKEVC